MLRLIGFHVRPDAGARAGLVASAEDLNAFLDAQRAKEGVDKVVVVGFSQGACLASETVLRNPRPYGFVGVLSGGASVFTTEAATAWHRLLAALEQPHRAGLVRIAALSPLLGFTAAELDAGGDTLVAALSSQLRGWVEVFEKFGAAALFEVVAAWRDLDARQLAVEGGERILTDLRHLAQLMNRAVTADRLGLASLTAWLANRCAEERNAATSDRSRLLDLAAAQSKHFPLGAGRTQFAVDESVKLELTLRSFDEAVMEQMIASVRRICAGLAAAHDRLQAERTGP